MALRSPGTNAAKPPFSVDANLLHTSSEGKALEDPNAEAPEFVYQRTVSPEEAPDKATIIEIGFKRGDPRLYQWQTPQPGSAADPA